MDDLNPLSAIDKDSQIEINNTKDLVKVRSMIENN